MIAADPAPLPCPADAPYPLGADLADRAIHWGSAVVVKANDLTLLIDGFPRLAGHSSSRPEGLGEALLREYSLQGPRVLERLAGGFAIAIFNARTRTATFAVDRFGIRSLCYHRDSQGVLRFATNPAALRSSLGAQARVDANALYAYLYFHMVPSPLCIFEGVRKLEPAQSLTVQRDDATLRRYWEPVFVETPVRNASALLAELLPTVQRAVADCEPDGKTASFLSGGLDSSTVAGCLAQLQGKGARAFSMGFATAGYDELEYARITAKHFDIDLIEYLVTARDVARVIPTIASVYGEPFGNNSAVPTFMCAAVARQHGVDHMLAGDGGDELFGGNSRYATQKLFDFYFKLPALLRSGLLEPLFLRSPAGSRRTPLHKLRRYIEQALIPMPARMQSWNLLETLGAKNVLSSAFRSRAQIDSALPLSLLRRTYDSAPAGSLLNRMLYLDWKITLADNDLRKVEGMCEAAGMRVSYPLLADGVVGLSTRVPPELKLRRLRLRHYYKRAIAGFLPRATIRKSKHGFGLPFGEWLRESPELRGLVFDALSDLKKRSLFEDKFLDDLITSHERGHAGYYGSMIWLLCILELWLVEHRVSL